MILCLLIGLAAGAFIGAAATTIAHWDASLKYRARASQTIQRLNEQLTERNREHENLKAAWRHTSFAARDVLGVRASGSIWAHHADGRDVVACNRRGSGMDSEAET
jgi:hypothetical protein